MEKQKKVTLVAVGDIAPPGEHPEEMFDLTRSTLREGDITFGQLERNLSERGTLQVQMRAARRAHPRGAKALSDAGFNILSFASNHALSWSEDAMLDTIDVLRKNNIVVIGAGKNIEEARQPAIFERKGNRVGFLAYCSVVPRGFDAKEDASGVAPVRATTFYEQVDWQPGTPPRIITRTNPDDLAAMVDDIRKLRPSVDVLVVSMHWGLHLVPSTIAMYQYEVGHAAIDAGADIIIGHHPHILKGIEVYKGKVIFFSLCNFAVSVSAERILKGAFRAFYVSIGKGWEIDPEYPNYAFPADSRKTIVVKCTIADKKIERVSFLPVMVNKKSQPEIVLRGDKRSSEVLEYMQWLCKDQNLDTKLFFDGDEIVVST